MIVLEQVDHKQGNQHRCAHEMGVALNQIECPIAQENPSDAAHYENQHKAADAQFVVMLEQLEVAFRTTLRQLGCVGLVKHLAAPYENIHHLQSDTITGHGCERDIHTSEQ